MKPGFVYIAARGKSGRLYTGVTAALTSCRGARLVWYEERPSLAEAKRRAADIRRWQRSCKRAVIARVNPGWQDLRAGR
jgi:putative endonuclease